MKQSVAVLESNLETREDYRRKLLARRREVLGGLNIRFDTLASMGSVADDDRAQISHIEFLSLHRNRMDYMQLRLVDEALDRIESGDYGLCLEQAAAGGELGALLCQVPGKAGRVDSPPLIQKAGTRRRESRLETLENSVTSGSGLVRPRADRASSALPTCPPRQPAAPPPGRL